MKLYSYFRSSASFRVRIALELKGLAYEIAPVHLLKHEQKSKEFLAINPLGLVPALIADEHVLTQSMAMIEYLDERHPHPPLMPKHAVERARVRALSQIVACDIAPFNNSGVMSVLRDTYGIDEAARAEWMAQWIARGLDAIEIMLNDGFSGHYAHGDTPTMADCVLAPQIFNAQRFSVNLDAYPRILALAARYEQHPAFIKAHPNQQIDAPAQ